MKNGRSSTMNPRKGIPSRFRRSAANSPGPLRSTAPGAKYPDSRKKNPMKNVWSTTSSRSNSPAADDGAVCCHFGQTSRLL
jgi:hypothetical protein